MKKNAFSDTATCNICGKEVKLKQAKLHLKKCREKSPLPAGTKEAEIFLLRIRGMYLKGYVLVVEMSGNQTLEALDGFLRNIWLECCGHLSAFRINGLTYDCCPLEFPFPGEDVDRGTFKAKLSDILSPGLNFSYEYDFGSSTDLELEVLDIRQTLEKPPTRPLLVMRNKPPHYECEVCGKPATFIVPQGYSADNRALFCSVCAENEEEDEEGEEFYGMRLVNSPRTGVCGYDTET